ncbi:MAG TPA: DUF72 domain-containing protein [Gemmatimonadaceae bacterium]|jgi:uncharacterized protein YecE (DUF72 family)
MSDAPTTPAVDPAHDPGVDAARARAAATGLAGTPVLTAPGGGRIRIGTAGWTDPTLTAPGVFYPDGTGSPEARLRHYADTFPLVEVDAPFYALPTAHMAQLWVQRTPEDFVFDVKAHALMTGHPTEVKRLPTVLRDALPRAVAAKGRIYPKDVPAEVMDAVWGGFVDAVQPLARAGKLGAILLQYPRWFVPGAPAREELLRARERLEGLPYSVEFRARGWFAPNTAEHTLRFLADHELPFVMVDEPQGLRSSVPPLVAVTSPRLAVLRLHGRRGDQWERRGTTVAEKYRYLYDRAELEEWTPKIVEAASQARETHVVFNNCYANYGTTNALEMGALLAAATP